MIKRSLYGEGVIFPCKIKDSHFFSLRKNLSFQERQNSLMFFIYTIKNRLGSDSRAFREHSYSTITNHTNIQARTTIRLSSALTS